MFVKWWLKKVPEKFWIMGEQDGDSLERVLCGLSFPEHWPMQETWPTGRIPPLAFKAHSKSISSSITQWGSALLPSPGSFLCSPPTGIPFTFHHINQEDWAMAAYPCGKSSWPDLGHLEGKNQVKVTSECSMNLYGPHSLHPQPPVTAPLAMNSVMM